MPEELKMGMLKGEVAGFIRKTLDRNPIYTRGISPANVFLKILVPGKKKSYSTYDEESMHKLKQEFPEIYHALFEAKALEARPVDAQGRFELKVPMGEWGYVVAARVEDKAYNHSLPKAAVFQSADFKEGDDLTIDNILIPVKDIWWKEAKGRKKGDPKTDPETVPAGTVDDDLYERIEQHRKERGSS